MLTLYIGRWSPEKKIASSSWGDSRDTVDDTLQRMGRLS